MASKRRKINEAMNAIAGKPADASVEKWRSQLSRAIEALLRNADLEALTAGQLDHLTRVLSGGTSAAWEEILRQSGLVRRAWHPKKGQPGVVREFESWTFGRSVWMDHLSIVIDKDKSIHFVSEPYSLTGEGIRQLAALVDEGWKVNISAVFSTHFPGHTLRITIRQASPKE